MPFDILDLDSLLIYGPYTTHAQARAKAKESDLRNYTIWHDGEKVETVGNPNPQRQQTNEPEERAS